MASTSEELEREMKQIKTNIRKKFNALRVHVRPVEAPSSSEKRNLLLKIDRLQHNIRNKYSAIRNNDVETQRQLAIQYKPLKKTFKEIQESGPAGNKEGT